MVKVRMPDGEAARNDDDATTLIVDYWRDVLTAQRTDEALQLRFLRFFPERPERKFVWTAEALESPFRKPRWIALGLDGVPFAACAALGVRGKELILGRV